jgi:putative SOS response-associated peptidase YedK
MCGRYAITTPPEAMRRLFGYPQMPNFPPRYNVAPTQPIPIVRVVDGRREFALVRWGLLPSWVKDPTTFTLLINARGETVNDKPAFRNAMKRRRCLIPADGFYEWKRDGAVKRPYLIRRKDGEPFAFAGLWETWMGPNGEELDTAAIVTSDANRLLAPIHNRMPVILSPDAWEMWLDTANVDAKTAAALIAPAQNELLEACEIAPLVNRIANDGPEVQAPYTAPEQPETAPAAKPAKAKATRQGKKDDRQSSLF